MCAPAHPWRSGDTVVALLAGVTVLARWPDRARFLQSWDANTFALALDRYDVYAHRPHAPGYPVYVAVARLVHVVISDAGDALVALSLLSTIVASIALYALGRQLVGRPATLAALVLMLAAPVVYVHSVTANAYTAEMACSLLVACAAWRAHHNPRPLPVAVLAFAVAAAIGVRPSLAFYLAPLLLWAVLRPPWGARMQVRRLALPAAVGLVTCLAWFLPMIMLSGGYSSWSSANRIQGGQVVFARTLFNTGWPALADNLERLALFFRWELAWILPVAATIGLAGLVAPRVTDRGTGNWDWNRSMVFLTLWLAPPLLFFATVYSGYNEGPSGYVLVVLPGLLLAVCGACARMLQSFHWKTPAVPALALVALFVSGGGLVSHRYDVADVAYKEHDEWAEAWSHLPESFPPGNSTIVALWHFAHVWNGFRDYTAYNFRPLGEGPELESRGVFVQVAQHGEAQPDWYSHDRTKDGPLHPLPNGTKHLVLFDFQLAGENGGPRRVHSGILIREAFLPNGWRVLIVDTTADRPNLEDYLSRQPVD